MAARVPTGMEREGSLRSPDMLTPAIIPVTAGKNRAKTDQKGAGSVRADPHISISEDSRGLPKKKETSEKTIAAMMKYWVRTAKLADLTATTVTRMVVPRAIAVALRVGKAVTTLSAKPMV